MSTFMGPFQKIKYLGEEQDNSVNSEAHKQHLPLSRSQSRPRSQKMLARLRRACQGTCARLRTRNVLDKTDWRRWEYVTLRDTRVMEDVLLELGNHLLLL
jgi:hypothetical protein